MKRLTALLITLAVLPMAHAGTYEQLKQKDESFAINWLEQQGEIVYDTVCGDYKKDSIIYRNCRREAQFFFRDKCNQAEDKSSKFCLATSRYYP